LLVITGEALGIPWIGIFTLPSDDAAFALLPILAAALCVVPVSTRHTTGRVRNALRIPRIVLLARISHAAILAALEILAAALPKGLLVPRVHRYRER